MPLMKSLWGVVQRAGVVFEVRRLSVLLTTWILALILLIMWIFVEDQMPNCNI